MAWQSCFRVSMPKNRSTSSSHDELVGMKWRKTRFCRSIRSMTLGCLWIAYLSEVMWISRSFGPVFLSLRWNRSISRYRCSRYLSLTTRLEATSVATSSGVVPATPLGVRHSPASASPGQRTRRRSIQGLNRVLPVKAEDSSVVRRIQTEAPRLTEVLPGTEDRCSPRWFALGVDFRLHDHHTRSTKLSVAPASRAID